MNDAAYREWEHLAYIRDVLCGPNAVMGSTLGHAFLPPDNSEEWEYSIDLGNSRATRSMVYTDRCPHGHLFDAANTYFVRNRLDLKSEKAGRRCRVCAKLRQQRVRLRARAG